MAALFSRTARVVHVAKRAVCILVALAMLHFLLSLLWSPPLEKARGSGAWRPGTAWGKPAQQPRSILDNLDATLEEEDCISLLRDSRRIRASVQLELQLLHDQRRELAEQVVHLSRTHTLQSVYRACVVYRTRNPYIVCCIRCWCNSAKEIMHDLVDCGGWVAGQCTHTHTHTHVCTHKHAPCMHCSCRPPWVVEGCVKSL